MIPARKSKLFLRWFAGVARSRIEKTFDAAYVCGIGHLRAHLDRPVIVVSNHTAYWDPLVAMWLTNHVTHIDSYALMDAKNLRRLPFFALTGAFGVDLDDPRDGGLAIR
ncbi:MAG: 1-acyl-sn-glycerol-3-phosphate acyltransferase, partial [Myxococcota bacterium]